MERIYISGKIENGKITKATIEKFARAEEMLKARGFDVINMLDEHIMMSTKASFEWRELKPNFVDYMLYRLQWLRTCRAIYMLYDFLDSPAAKVEHAFAIAAKIQVYYDDELYRDGTLRGKAYRENRLPEKSE